MSDLIIGLTGPTGAGKSTVAAVLAAEGCHVIDADRVAREITSTPACLAELKREYGEDIVSAGGTLNRRLLARRAFSSPRKAERLNEITHPAIIREVLARAGAALRGGARAVVLDAALLFESGTDRCCTVSVAVTAPPEVRLVRIMKRDGIPESLARARISAQQSSGFYRERADYVLDGAMGMDRMAEETRRLLRKIVGEVHENA